MSFNLFTYARKICRPLLLDGAMGSLLQQKGIKSEGKLWTGLANLNQTRSVYQIYKSYVDAGADIITTNTFRTNPLALKAQTDYNSKKLIKASIAIAKYAAENSNVLIAGSNAPAEDCYQTERTITRKELEYNHKQHIDELMKNGCDFVLNETQSHFDEIKIICDYCYSKRIPFVLSLLVNDKLTLLSGEKLDEVIKYIISKNPLAIGFNCFAPRIFDLLRAKIKLDFNWGLYLNLFGGDHTSPKMVSSLSPNLYSKFISKHLIMRPSFVGGCCGSTPNHIKKLRQVLDGKFNY